MGNLVGFLFHHHQKPCFIYIPYHQLVIKFKNTSIPVAQLEVLLMHKLREIETSLTHDGRIILVGRDQNRDSISGWSHIVEYWVAPKHGLYTPVDLQYLLIQLVPSVTPTFHDCFRNSADSLFFGRLYFDEVFHQRNAEGICADYDSIPAEMTSSGLQLRIQRGEETDHSHRIFVHLVPDERIARDILRGKLPLDFMISKRDLADYLPN